MNYGLNNLGSMLSSMERPFPFQWFPSWTDDLVLRVPIWQWVALALALFLGILIKKTATHLVRLKFKRGVPLQDLGFTDIVAKSLGHPLGMTLATLFWFVCVDHINFQPSLQARLLIILKVLLGCNVIWACYNFVDVLTYRLRHSPKHTSEIEHLLPIFSKTLRAVVIVMGTLVLMQNLGFNVMSLIAGLGLGGLALALAAKDTAANLFGSVMILVDRPFKIGDWIVTSEGEGTVEEIGFRSTRIRTFYDSLVSIPNSSLAVLKVDNMGQRSYRRIREFIGVTYDTPVEKIQQFCEGVTEIILSYNETRRESYYVVLNRFSESSLDILMQFFIRAPDGITELKLRQDIFIKILKLAEEMEVQFAFPTRTVHVESFSRGKNSSENKS